MFKLRRSLVVGFLCMLSGCALLPSFRESSYVEEAVRAVEGVTFVNVYGWREPIWEAKGGLTVDVIVNNQTLLSFDDVGYTSVGPSATRVAVSEVGDLRPFVRSCLEGPSWHGDPVKNPRRRVVRADFHAAGQFGAHVEPGIVDIVDAVRRYRDLQGAVMRWPRCPSYWEFSDGGADYRYCVAGAAPELPAWPSGCG